MKLLSPSPLRVLLCSATAALALSGCASDEIAVGGPKENRAERLVGEWISPSNPNHYLVFKPEPMETREGRILGLDNFQNYRITRLSALTPNLTLELTSRDDAWEAHSGYATVVFAKDGQSITVTLPPASSTAKPVTRLYKRSSAF